MSYDKHSIDGIKQGVKVRFTGDGGYTKQNSAANSLLVINDVYTVKVVKVYDFHASVWLEGYEGPFNCIMFEVASELFN